MVEKIAKHTNLPLAQPIKIFPDGEIYVRIDFDLGREGVFLIQSMFPNQNDAIIEVLLLTDTSIDLRTKRAVGIFLVYSRQDKRFQNGEALSIKTSARLFKAVSIKEIITVDAHSHRKPQKLFFLEFLVQISQQESCIDMADHKLWNWETIKKNRNASNLFINLI